MTLIALFSTMYVQMKQSFARPMFRFCLFVNPILNTILLYEMYSGDGGKNFLAYGILGAGLMGLWSCICFSSIGDINREKYSGTLSIIFVSPTKFPVIILGKILGNTIMSLVTLLLSFATAKIIFGVHMQLRSPVFFLIALLSTIISFIVISSVVACLLILSRKTELYMNCFEIPIILLCGCVFPVSVLPNVVRIISYALAPTYAIELMRMAIGGVNDTFFFFKKLVILIVLTVTYTITSVLLYKRIERRVRVTASLEVL